MNAEAASRGDARATGARLYGLSAALAVGGALTYVFFATRIAQPERGRVRRDRRPLDRSCSWLRRRSSGPSSSCSHAPSPSGHGSGARERRRPARRRGHPARPRRAIAAVTAARSQAADPGQPVQRRAGAVLGDARRPASATRSRLLRARLPRGPRPVPAATLPCSLVEALLRLAAVVLVAAGILDGHPAGRGGDRRGAGRGPDRHPHRPQEPAGGRRERSPGRASDPSLPSAAAGPSPRPCW